MNDDTPGDRLVTIATFWSPVEANLARNNLDAAGIRAILVGEETVGMAWHLTNAIGGVKVQVREADADRALVVLDEISPVHAEPLSTEPDAAGYDPDIPDEAADDEGDLEDPGEPQENRQWEDVSERELNQREKDAEKALRVAMLGLLLLPLQLYVFWLLGRVYLSEEPLASDKRWAAFIAGAINFPFVLLVFICCSGMIMQ